MSNAGMKRPSQTPTVKKQRRLTIKQRRFINKTLQTGNATQAALEVYDVKSQKVAKDLAAENLSKPAIREQIERALAEEELETKDIFKMLLQNAKSGLGIKATASDSNNALKILANLIALEDRVRDKGDNIYNFNFTNLPPEEIKAKLEELRSNTDSVIQD